MNISSFGEVYKMGGLQTSQSTIDSVEKIVSQDIIRRLYPVALKQSPKSLGNVESRANA